MEHPPLQHRPITDSDRNRYADTYNEGVEHLWGKRASYEECLNNEEAEVVIERYLGDCRPDILIEAPIPSSDTSDRDRDAWSPEWPIEGTDSQSDEPTFVMQGRVVEIVTESAQRVLPRIRNALRCGYVIHWVFLDEEKAATVREDLDPYLTESVNFGRLDPYSGDFSLGDAISFDNFEFVVTSLNEFIPLKLKGRGWSLHYGGVMGFNVGEFLLDGDRRRVYCYGDGRRLHSYPPDEVEEPSNLSEEKYTLRDVHHLVKDGVVKRVGPTAGHRRKRYADSGKISNAYIAPKHVKRMRTGLHRL